jgi:hypothetical protein
VRAAIAVGASLAETRQQKISSVIAPSPPSLPATDHRLLEELRLTRAAIDELKAIPAPAHLVSLEVKPAERGHEKTPPTARSTRLTSCGASKSSKRNADGLRSGATAPAHVPPRHSSPRPEADCARYRPPTKHRPFKEARG